MLDVVACVVPVVVCAFYVVPGGGGRGAAGRGGKHGDETKYGDEVLGTRWKDTKYVLRVKLKG